MVTIIVILSILFLWALIGAAAGHGIDFERISVSTLALMFACGPFVWLAAAILLFRKR